MAEDVKETKNQVEQTGFTSNSEAAPAKPAEASKPEVQSETQTEPTPAEVQAQSQFARQHFNGGLRTITDDKREVKTLK